MDESNDSSTSTPARNGGWNYLEKRPRSWRQQLYVKGTPFKAYDIYEELLANDETHEEAAEVWNLPIEAIDEIVAYCTANKNLIKRELRDEHYRMEKTRRKISLTSRWAQSIGWPLFLFLLVFAVAILLKDFPLYFSYVIGFILFLRFVNNIPVIGPSWVNLFGEKDLWEWLQMTVAPLSLAILGAYITSNISGRQAEVNVEKTRHDVTQRFVDLLTPGSETFKDLSNKPKLVKAELYKNKKNKKNDYRNVHTLTRYPGYKLYSDCYNFPESSWLTTQTQMTLSQLSGLDTYVGNKTAQKRYVLQLIKQLELIQKGKNIISLRGADMSDSKLMMMDLTDSCLESVLFADYAASPESGSDLRHTKLDGSDLSGANLKYANLRNASLTNVDLRGAASIANADLRGANLTGAKIDLSTKMNGALINTMKIDIAKRKEQWWYQMFCNSPIRKYARHTFLCLDNIDYQNLNPTKLPKFCENLNGKESCRSLTEEEIIEKGFKVDNSLPTQ